MNGNFYFDNYWCQIWYKSHVCHQEDNFHTNCIPFAPNNKNESKYVNVIYQNYLIRYSMESYNVLIYQYVTYKILSGYYLQNLFIAA